MVSDSRLIFVFWTHKELIFDLFASFSTNTLKTVTFYSIGVYSVSCSPLCVCRRLLKIYYFPATSLWTFDSFRKSITKVLYFKIVLHVKSCSTFFIYNNFFWRTLTLFILSWYTKSFDWITVLLSFRPWLESTIEVDHYRELFLFYTRLEYRLVIWVDFRLEAQ